MHEIRLVLTKKASPCYSLARRKQTSNPSFCNRIADVLPTTSIIVNNQQSRASKLHRVPTSLPRQLSRLQGHQGLCEPMAGNLTFSGKHYSHPQGQATIANSGAKLVAHQRRNLGWTVA